MDDAIYQKIDKLQEQSIEVYKNYYKEVDAVRKAELWQKYYLIEREIDDLYNLARRYAVVIQSAEIGLSLTNLTED